ncbi:hypothetical protein PHLGIDRAFT_348773 [Phlebiopsis gigantea 11061_1 CR5-6]|uniref:Uncharacterized protein n=1 Tax=Phlebiopsis gigantea (strain 11061_1 CR5-6) TaxID=745531 RepID=A0A0C3P9X5_PHLG1|nr:hypothetical protein PHLGIDRAFT_348773 [Phlebiopsis gigantea 11061_1 CR5-6]
MRGPNKVKRKGQSKDRSSRPSRRASVASTVSDDDFGPSSPRARVDTAPRQFTMQFDLPPLVDGRASASSGSLSATPSPRSEHSYSSPSREQLRPPPISLAGTGLYDHARLPLPHDVTPFGFDAQSPSGLRRASLPAYILEHHLRSTDAAGRTSFDHSVYAPPRGLDAVERTPRPRSSPAFPLLSPFAEAAPSACSSSGTSPRTPLELTYPVDDFSPAAAPPGFTPDFASFARFDGPAGWLGDDVDATPTLGADGDDAKRFPPYVHSEFTPESPE